MAKEKGSNLLQVWRRKEKEKATKARRKARDEKLAEIPAHRLDPAPLVSEIYRLSVLEYEGKLNSDMKQRKKRLCDQYHSIKKARTTAGLETIELVEFDPDAYEEAKMKQIQSKRQKLENQKLVFPNEKINSEIKETNNNNNYSSNLNQMGLPELPDGPFPTEEELLSLGLPAYSPFPYENITDDEEEEERGIEEEYIDNIAEFDDLEAQLEAEYELFKESLDDS